MPVAGHLVGVSYSGPLPLVSALKGRKLEMKLFEMITVVLKMLQPGWYGAR